MGFLVAVSMIILLFKCINKAAICVCVCVQSEAVLQVADVCLEASYMRAQYISRDSVWRQHLRKHQWHGKKMVNSRWLKRRRMQCECISINECVRVPRTLRLRYANNWSAEATIHSQRTGTAKLHIYAIGAHECMCGCEQIRCKRNQQRHQMAHGIRVSRAMSLAKITRVKSINNATTAVYTSSHMAILWVAIIGTHTHHCHRSTRSDLRT